jgi:hypothetical protein
MKNFILYTLLATFIVLFITGTMVAIMNKEIGLVAFSFAGIGFVIGINVGHTGGVRVAERMQMIRSGIRF